VLSLSQKSQFRFYRQWISILASVKPVAHDSYLLSRQSLVPYWREQNPPLCGKILKYFKFVLAYYLIKIIMEFGKILVIAFLSYLFVCVYPNLFRAETNEGSVGTDDACKLSQPRCRN
jgi:hypothetical protein